MKAYIKIFLSTSVFFTLTMFIYMYLTDPIFHYKYTLLIRTLVLIGVGIIFGILNIGVVWFLKKKNPNLYWPSNPRQNRVVYFHGNINEALCVCKQAFRSLKIIETKNSNTMMLTGNTPWNWLRGAGEHIEIRLLSPRDDVIEIHISSKPRPNIILYDLGQGLYNVTVVEKELQRCARIEHPSF